MPDPPEPVPSGANAGAAPGTALATPGSIQSPAPVQVEVGSHAEVMGFLDDNGGTMVVQWLIQVAILCIMVVQWWHNGGMDNCLNDG